MRVGGAGGAGGGVWDVSVGGWIHGAVVVVVRLWVCLRKGWVSDGRC